MVSSVRQKLYQKNPVKIIFMISATQGPPISLCHFVPLASHLGCIPDSGTGERSLTEARRSNSSLMTYPKWPHGASLSSHWLELGHMVTESLKGSQGMEFLSWIITCPLETTVTKKKGWTKCKGQATVPAQWHFLDPCLPGTSCIAPGQLLVFDKPLGASFSPFLFKVLSSSLWLFPLAGSMDKQSKLAFQPPPQPSPRPQSGNGVWDAPLPSFSTMWLRKYFRKIVTQGMAISQIQIILR